MAWRAMAILQKEIEAEQEVEFPYGYNGVS
jgi:hypothetical protein